MKNQITFAQKIQMVLAALVMLVFTSTTFAQMPGSGGPGSGGGGNPTWGGHPHHHHGGHGGPGGGTIGGGHPSMTCNAHFAARRDTIVNGVRFHTFGGSGAATYSWTFGDGGTSTVQNPNYVYADTGLYNVCLTVTDTVGGGCTDTWCDTIHVFTPAPHCNAHFGARGDSLANTLNFHRGPSSPGTTYSWDFGDGSTSTDPNPQHTYAAAGIYYVCLTVSNTNAGGSCTDTWCDSVDTSMPPCPGPGPGGHHRVASSTANNADAAIVTVYPNPMVESTNIYLENTSGNAMLRIYSISGSVVMTKQVGNGDNKITKENLTEGLYFYSIDDGDSNITKGKLRVY